MYGRCLPQAQPVQVPGLSDVTRKDPGRKEAPVCFQWNKGRCLRPLCSYRHACSECKGPHRKSECPGQVKESKSSEMAGGKAISRTSPAPDWIVKLI